MRKPAIACALAKVRNTSRFGSSATSAAASSPGSRKSANASSSSTHTRSPTRSHSARTSSRATGAPVGSLGLESAIARVSGADAVGQRADAALARHGDRPAAGALGELGQRPPARPRDEQLTARPEQLRARLLQQLGGAVADRDLLRRDAVARGGELAHLACAAGPGRRSCAAAARRWRR